jgi:AcrR family transcriptional regulator
LGGAIDDARTKQVEILRDAAFMTNKKGSARRGRPRSAAAESAVLDKTYELIVRDGLAGATIDAIARLSKVSKVTIYKWWPSREALMVDAFLRRASRMLPWKESGNAKAAVRSHAAAYAKALIGEFGAVQLAVISDCIAQTGSTSLFTQHYLDVRRALGVRTIERGQRDGTIDARRPAADLYDQIYGTLFYRYTFGLRPFSPGYARELVDSVLGTP